MKSFYKTLLITGLVMFISGIAYIDIMHANIPAGIFMIVTAVFIRQKVKPRYN